MIISIGQGEVFRVCSLNEEEVYGFLPLFDINFKAWRLAPLSPYFCRKTKKGEAESKSRKQDTKFIARIVFHEN